MTRSFLTILVVSALAGGCVSNAKRANMLLEDVRGYHDGLRWQRFAQAVLRLPLAERDDFLEERDELAEDLRIGDWEIVRVNYTREAKRAKVVVKYTWHLDSRGIVHTTTATERWERRGKRWIVLEEERTRGEPMPGLAEPSEEPVEDAKGAKSAAKPPTETDSGRRAAHASHPTR